MIREWIINENEAPTEKKEAARTAPTYEYSVVESSGCDAVIERKKHLKKGDKSAYLVLVASQGKNGIYIKTETGQIESVTERSANEFFRYLHEDLEISPEFWLSVIPGDSTNRHHLFSLGVYTVTGTRSIFDEMKDVSSVFTELAKRGYADITTVENNRFHRVYESTVVTLCDILAEECGKVEVKKALTENGDARIREMLHLSLFSSVDEGSVAKKIVEDFGFDGLRTIVHTYVNAPTLCTGANEYAISCRNSFRLSEVLEEVKTSPAKKIAEYLSYGKNRQGFELVHDFVNEWARSLNLQHRVCGAVRDKFPENLLSLNYKLDTLCNLAHEEEVAKGVAARSEELSSLAYDDGQYIIFPPSSTQEIFDEKVQQSNCIADFINSYATGETNLFFMRKSACPKKSLVSIEVRNGEVRQAYRAKNILPNQEEMNIIVHWAKANNIVVPSHWCPMGV